MTHLPLVRTGSWGATAIAVLLGLGGGCSDGTRGEVGGGDEAPAEESSAAGPPRGASREVAQTSLWGKCTVGSDKKFTGECVMFDALTRESPIVCGLGGPGERCAPSATPEPLSEPRPRDGLPTQLVLAAGGNCTCPTS